MNSLEVTQIAADLLEARDVKGLQALMAEVFKAKGPSMELTKQQTLGYLQVLFTAFPDHRFGFTDFEENGELVSCTGQETGTHQGIFDLKPFGIPLTLPPTGKSFRLPKSKFSFRTANDQLTYFSESATEGGGLAGILAQLGVKLP